MFKKFHTRTGLLHDVGQTVNDLGGLLGSVLDPDGTTGSTTPKPDSNTGTSGNEEGSGSLNPSSSVAPAVPSSQMPPSAESSPTPTVQTSNSQNVAPAGSPILSSTSGSPSVENNTVQPATSSSTGISTQTPVAIADSTSLSANVITSIPLPVTTTDASGNIITLTPFVPLSGSNLPSGSLSISSNGISSGNTGNGKGINQTGADNSPHTIGSGPIAGIAVAAIFSTAVLLVFILRLLNRRLNKQGNSQIKKRMERFIFNKNSSKDSEKETDDSMIVPNANVPSRQSSSESNPNSFVGEPLVSERISHVWDHLQSKTFSNPSSVSTVHISNNPFGASAKSLDVVVDETEGPPSPVAEKFKDPFRRSIPPTLHHQTSQLSNHSAAVYKSHQPNSSDEENYETAGESIRHSISSDFTLESGILGYLHGDKNSSYERFPKSRMRTMDDRETKEPDSPFRLDFAEELLNRPSTDSRLSTYTHESATSDDAREVNMETITYQNFPLIR